MRFGESQKGLSLLEVLVAVVILSIGLLGTAALQIQSKRSNLGSIERTLASMLVNDMFERMRANPDSYGIYLTELDASKLVGKGGGTAPTPDCKTASTECAPTQLAQRDVWEWEQLLIGATEVSGTANTGGLVLPRACLTGPAGGGGEGSYTLAIVWRGQSEFTGATSPNNCGLGSGLYDGDSGADTLRRIIVVNSYLDD